MALQTRISTAARNAAADGIVDLCDVGGAGTLEVRTGTAPATPATADSGTLLATFTLAATAFGAAATGVATAAAIASVTAAASGTAGYFRVKNNAGTVIWQGTCGIDTVPGTYNLEFDDPVIVSGGTVAISALTFTVPQDE